MDAKALQTVSAAIQARLAADIGGSVHVGPLDDDEAAAADLVMFLYRLAINADLRNAGHRRPPREPAAQVGRQRPDIATEEVIEGALPLDLYYILSASPSKAGSDLDGLGRLGAAIQTLNDRPLLVGPPVVGEIVRLCIDAVSSEEMARIWSLFPTVNYRTSVVFMASPVWIDPRDPAPAIVPVVSERYDAPRQPARGP